MRIIQPLSKFLVIVLTLLSFSSFQVHAIIESQTYTSSEMFKIFQTFGFYEGGSVDLNITATASYNLYFFLCSSEQLNDGTKTLDKPAQLCTENKLENLNCEFHANFTQSLSVRTIVNRSETFHFLLVNCDNQQITFTLRYILLNPGQQHLSTGYIPLPTLYIALAVSWSVLLSMWLLNWGLYRMANSIKLHRFLTLIPVSKIVLSIVDYVVWYHLSVYGSLDVTQSIIQLVAVLCFKGAFFCTLILIAKGWCVIRSELIPMERKALIFTMVAFLIAQIFETLQWGYYYFVEQFFNVITFIAVLRMIFASVAYNTRALKIQLRFVHDAQIDPRPTPLYEKYVMLKTFQSSMVAYVIMYVLIHLIQIFFLAKYVWIEYMLLEILDVFLICIIGWVFRLRDFRAYLEVSGNSATESEESEEVDGDFEVEAASQTPGSPPVIIVIQNPTDDTPDNHFTNPSMVMATVVGKDGEKAIKMEEMSLLKDKDEDD